MGAVGEFLDKYVAVLIDLNDKSEFILKLSDDAYIEIAKQLPKINSNLKSIISEIGDVKESLVEHKLLSSEELLFDSYIATLKVPLKIILEIMSSLQAQDKVKQCIEHTIIAIRKTSAVINSINPDVTDTRTFTSLKYLMILPKLFIAQLENIYEAMNDSIYDISKRFNNISEMISPSLTLEEMIAGDEKKNIGERVYDILLQVKARIANDSTDTMKIILSSIGRVLRLKESIEQNVQSLDESAAATKILEQPLAELILLNNNLLATSQSAESLLTELYNGNSEDLNCDDMLRDIVNVFSTKDEIDIARRVLDGLNIEEAGDEGEVTLF